MTELQHTTEPPSVTEIFTSSPANTDTIKTDDHMMISLNHQEKDDIEEPNMNSNNCHSVTDYQGSGVDEKQSNVSRQNVTGDIKTDVNSDTKRLQTDICNHNEQTKNIDATLTQTSESNNNNVVDSNSDQTTVQIPDADTNCNNSSIYSQNSEIPTNYQPINTSDFTIQQGTISEHHSPEQTELNCLLNPETGEPTSGNPQPDYDEDAIRQAGYYNLDRPGTPLPGPFAPGSEASLCNGQTSSEASSSDLLPVCRICQQHEEDEDHLFAPCRCSGTLQYIHHSCLLRWIEYSTKKSRKPPTCEICEYQFHRRKTFKLRHWKWPRVSRIDKLLHIVFLINLILMIGCATATVMCFLSDKGHISKFPQNKMHLSTEEIITLSCGVLFFVSFFVAMSVEIKAKHTIYKLMMKFVMMNMSWEIEEYDKRRDLEEKLLFNKDPNCV